MTIAGVTRGPPINEVCPSSRQPTKPAQGGIFRESGVPAGYRRLAAHRQSRPRLEFVGLVAEHGPFGRAVSLFSGDGSGQERLDQRGAAGPAAGGTGRRTGGARLGGKGGIARGGGPPAGAARSEVADTGSPERARVPLGRSRFPLC